MNRPFQLISETLEYTSSPDPTNLPQGKGYLVAGSQNVIIDYNKKCRVSGGYSRYGAANAAETPVRYGKTWNSSTGLELPIRFYDDEMEVYLGTVDGTVVNAWTRITNNLSTTAQPRADIWWDTGENLDLFLFILADANIYEWGGGVAVASSTTSNTITKTGTATFAQNRFYTSRNRSLINVRTGVEYAYTGGAGTTQVTGVSPDPTSDIVAGDILIQKIVTQSNKPVASHTNSTIFVFENQLVIGSSLDNEVYLSKNTSYYDFSFSSPRVSGEGALLVLDSPSGGFGVNTKNLIMFAGKSSIFRAQYEQTTVGSTLAETLTVKKLKTGENQGCQSPETIVPVGNTLVYLTYEPTLRALDQTQINDEPDLKTLSNPIKPDFDAETFTNASAIWYKNTYILSANSHLWMLQYIEDANGVLRRYWQPPQLFPVRSMVLIGGVLHGHSNAVAETYKLFDTYSGINSSDEKLPISAVAKFAYYSGGKRAELKNFDEYYVEGAITPSTSDLELLLNYDYAGFTQQVTKTIDGTDEEILEEFLTPSSLGQASLGTQPIGGLITAPSDARKFRVILENAREDFHEIQAIFSTNDVDKYWEILSHGANFVLSARKDIRIHK